MDKSTKLQAEILQTVKSGQGRLQKDIEELREDLRNETAVRERLEWEWDNSRDRAGSPAPRPGGPGHAVTLQTDALDVLKRFGKASFRLENGLFSPFESKAITSSSVGSSTPGILTPERISDFISKPRRRLTLRDFLPSRPTEAASVEFIRENVVPAASPQVEASAKFETDQSYLIAEAKVRTFAAWVSASRQILDDLPGLSQTINQSLLFALAKLEEDQLLTGDGAGENLNGIQTQAAAYAGTHNVAGDNKLDRLRHAVLELENADESPDFFVLNPTDVHDIELLKAEESGTANTGNYVVGSPLGVLLEAKTLWGRTVISTTAQTAGTFLVGARNMAEIFDRMSAVVDISTEHSDFFVKNMVAIRAEERIALAVYRTSAFLTGTF